MATKKVNYNKKGIENLPNDKPVLYRIQTDNGKPNYIGTAKKGRVQERIEEHLGEIPGATVKIEQFNSIKDAQKTEQRAIKLNQPKYNQENK
jgi:excinuclease UvrABC nuclease subunit